MRLKEITYLVVFYFSLPPTCFSQSQLIATTPSDIRDRDSISVPETTLVEYNNIINSYVPKHSSIYPVNRDLQQMLRPLGQPFFLKKINKKASFGLKALNLSDEIQNNAEDNILQFDEALTFSQNVNILLRELPESIKEFKILLLLKMKIPLLYDRHKTKKRGYDL